MGYDLVTIKNSTNYPATGLVKYEDDDVCSNDKFTVNPGGVWTAKSRGLCLVQVISAALTVDGKAVNATTYSSSGTSYSQWVIVENNDGTFTVSRVVN